jgi:hypothetical protein
MTESDNSADDFDVEVTKTRRNQKLMTLLDKSAQ